MIISSFFSTQDRFAAIAHILPPIDESQDWYLVNSDQQNGYTMMEVTRQLVTCDKKDVPIRVKCNRVIVLICRNFQIMMLLFIFICKQAGLSHIVFAYHSKGPDYVTSLDSLTPEHLGAISVNLIPGTGNEVKNVSWAIFVMLAKVLSTCASTINFLYSRSRLQRQSCRCHQTLKVIAAVVTVLCMAMHNCFLEVFMKVLISWYCQIYMHGGG